MWLRITPKHGKPLIINMAQVETIHVDREGDTVITMVSGGQWYVTHTAAEILARANIPYLAVERR